LGETNQSLHKHWAYQTGLPRDTNLSLFSYCINADETIYNNLDVEVPDTDVLIQDELDNPVNFTVWVIGIEQPN